MAVGAVPLVNSPLLGGATVPAGAALPAPPAAQAAPPSSERIQLEANISEAKISGDASQLAQVVRNLIENALKHGGTDLPVIVNVEKGSTGWISLSVIDKGDGIAPQHMPRLTERFYRADPGRSRQIGGTGLGLAIVKHIVERHRGRFDIASRLGQGTTATCIFPPS